MINYDLENSPLLVKTNSEVGSYQGVEVYFYNAEEDLAGGVRLLFSSSLKYWLSLCSGSFTDFPTAIPQETNKVWKITLTRNSGGIRLVITCNNKEVLNVVLSDTTCTDDKWSRIWSRDVVKIKFTSWDEASDYYRLERLCPGLSVEKAQVSPSGDVKQNNVVTVTCLNPYLLLGNHEVTCLSTGWSVYPECRECGIIKVGWVVKKHLSSHLT
ncbi:hypothetical protein ACHWQZ_G019543 [Mnemiopsis leidyi]